jgi:alpha-tubulin suppressor-like RCC1 family protein
VSAGGWHSTGLRTDGTLWAWGDNTTGELGDGTMVGHLSPEQIGTSTWKSVSSSLYHNGAIRSDGTLWTWGFNNVNQLGDGTTTTRSVPIEIDAGSWRSVASGWYFGAAVLRGRRTGRRNAVGVG